ncbi:ABC transporter permease [uncultured Muribaculum sp.]|uniref:ABC transporter permease n=1 Tax=uncultured Muribaculum sp. TaxID=1918613 RepID=UPI0025EE978A|nr:ABC transporter permease [uncultured Muribaculum sp.]
MNKTRLWLVLRREYLSIVAKKSFIVTTILVPFLIVSLGFAMGLMMVLNEAEGDRVAVIDQSGRYASALENTSEYVFESPADYTVANMRDKFESQEDDDEEGNAPYYAIVVIPASVDSILQVSVYSSSPTRSSLREEVESQLSKAITDARVASYGIPELDRIIKESQAEVVVRTNTWNADGETSVTSDDLMSVIGMALAFLTYMFVLTYGAMIMSSVVEDKVNRIVEVIVSSCKPIELMLGKIMGVALVGLTQVAIWAVLLGVGLLILSGIGVAGAVAAGSGAALDAASMGPDAAAVITADGEFGEMIQAILGVNWLLLLGMFIVYFIGGYLLYASLFAAFGSAVDQQSDANQFMTPLMMIIVFSLFIGQSCMQNPDGTLGVVCSIIPFTSPIVMMVRLPYEVPVWEMLTSVAILYGTAAFFTWLSARIYRRGILMYGHKSTFADLWRWVK